MCAVSAVLDYGTRIDPGLWSRHVYDSFLDMVQKAEQFDKAANQPDCTDPAKAQLLGKLKSLVEQLENGNDNQEPVTSAGLSDNADSV